MSMIIECSKQLDAITIKQNSNGLLHSLATIRLESTVGTVSSIKVSAITTTYNFNYTKPPKNTIILRLGFKALFFPKKNLAFSETLYIYSNCFPRTGHNSEIRSFVQIEI